jgi:hypothetical protein
MESFKNYRLPDVPFSLALEGSLGILLAFLLVMKRDSSLELRVSDVRMTGDN